MGPLCSMCKTNSSLYNYNSLSDDINYCGSVL